MAYPADVEISLVNTDNRALLERCLASLREACGDLSWHVTVVDNASGDGSAEMVARLFPGVKLIRNYMRQGFSANHNKVIGSVLESASTARYVLVLNEDTELDPDSVHRLVRYCDENRTVGAAGPVIRGRDGVIQRSFLPLPTISNQVLTSLRTSWASAPRGNAGWLNGSCLLLRCHALRETGPLDDRFFIFFEDTDIGIRLMQAGWTSTVVEAATILHHGHATVARPLHGSAMECQMLRSRYLYFVKHRGRMQAALMSSLIRTTFVARGLKAGIAGIAGRNAQEQEHARLLFALTRYDPSMPLAHEEV